MPRRRSYTFDTALLHALITLGVLVSCSPATTQPVTPKTVAPRPQIAPKQTQVPPRPAPSATVPAAPPLPPIPPPSAGDIGRHVPTSFVTTSPSGHWSIVCEASEDTDHSGNLTVQVGQHGELTGDTLKQILYRGDAAQPIDEYAGSDPSGRFLAYVKNGSLHLQNTVSNESVALEHADTRATEASFQPLRSVSFSDDGKWMAYAQGDRDVTLRSLESDQETTYSIEDPKLYRLRFAAGSRFLILEVITTDTNKNGKLSWLTPQRTDKAPCPSPIPSYNVWQFPGDTPEMRLLDVKTGNLITPQGFAFAAGNIYLERTEDLSLLVHEPGKPVRNVSSAECAGRVMHVDLVSGNVVFGCASAWGQRRQIFLRTADSRIGLNFDLAAYELDARLDTTEPTIAFYPGNQTLLFNVRTRERWPLLDGTQVHTLIGTTALIEVNQQLSLVKLEPDGSNRPLTTPIPRPAYAGLLRQGPWVSLGNQVFQLEQGQHAGAFASLDTPLALSDSGQGLYLTRPATPTTLGSGPLRWVAAAHKR